MLSRARRLPVAALWLLLAVSAYCARASNPHDDRDNFKWDEAAKEVSDFPYKQTFIDSLREAYSVTWPGNPLRVIAKKAPVGCETLVYDIGWGPIKAGYVILSAEPDPKRRVIRLGGKALSNGFVSAFYRMRDYVISTIDDTGLYPLFFEQHLREGKRYKSDGWILYDHRNNKLFVKERELKTLNAVPFVNDYLSVLYMVRAMHFAPGDTFALPLYADKKVHRLFMICRERKVLRIDDKDVPCLLMEPKLVGDKGAFNKKDRLQVWLSDDDRKVPLLIKSKINIGSITARLVQSMSCPAAPPVLLPEGGAKPSSLENAEIPASDSGTTPQPPDSGAEPKPPDGMTVPESPDSGGAPAPSDSGAALKTPDSLDAPSP